MTQTPGRGGTMGHDRRIVGVAMGSLIALFAGCSSAAEPEGGSMTGSIVARDVRISIGNAPTVHVKENTGDPCGVIFLVRGSTAILRRTGSGVRPTTYSELTIGSNVKVWTSIILDSCPGQASAQRIELLPCPRAARVKIPGPLNQGVKRRARADALMG